jgi:hypothetical protein
MTSIDPSMNMLLKDAMRFFIHEEIFISLDPPSIVVGPLSEKRILDEKKFYDL